MNSPKIPVDFWLRPRRRHGHDAQPLVLGPLPFQRPLGAQVLHEAAREDAREGA